MNPTSARMLRVAGTGAAVLAAVVGAGIVLVAATLGHCSAFGGRCPAEAPPLWDDDVFGTSAIGGALVAGPLLALRSGPHRWSSAVVGAIVAAVVVGLLVRAAAHG